MIDSSYLIMGLDGLSHAHEKDHFRDGHLAASVIAAYYLCHENSLDEATQELVKFRIDTEYRDDVLFRPVAEEAADSVLLEELLNTLSSGLGDYREVGHNIIFGNIAIKAFRDCPQAITPTRIEGICRLIESFTSTQNVALEADDGVPDVADESALIRFIFSEYLRSVALYTGFGQGWAGHLLTIGHAVIELARFGYPQHAAQAHHAYRMYIRTMRRGPDESSRQIPEHSPSSLTPLDKAYWEQGQRVRPGLGHAFKYPYSFFNLMQGLNDPELKARCLAESYRIF
jgi:hypothetical protein